MTHQHQHSIVGGWTLDGDTDDETVAFTFLDNGNFMLAHGNHPEDALNGQAGIEFGSYNWNVGTGALSYNILTDTNGSWGLSDGAINGLTINGDTMTFSESGFDVETLTRVGVSSVPVPSAVWLFGSGLLGLVGGARRKKA